MKNFLCLIIAALLFVQPCMAAEEEPVLSGEAQEKVTDLLNLLAAVDAGGNGMYFSPCLSGCQYLLLKEPPRRLRS